MAASTSAKASDASLPAWQRRVTYGAVGGTQADDLLAHPPAGYRAIRRRKRIGHGDNRFAWASAQTMTWGIQRLSGFGVRVAFAPPEVTEQTYVPVAFDASGAPIQSAAVTERGERIYAADGTAYLVPGDTAVLSIRFLGIRVKAPARVVYIVDEPQRKGFAYGTLEGHPERGEESCSVEKTDDGSVWVTISAFSRPSSRWWWVLYLPLRIAQEKYTSRYLRVLAGPTD